MGDAREIIARAYDREQAAQMGEPDPWKDNTDDPQWNDSLGCAEAVISALHSAGYRLVKGLDPETLTAVQREAVYRDAENAEVECSQAGCRRKDCNWLICRRSIDAAIRSLGETK